MPIVTFIGSTQMVSTELFNELMPSRPEIRCLLFNTEDWWWKLFSDIYL